MTEPRQLAKLARPIPDALVKERTVGGGRKASYVGHASITEMLLLIVGPFDQRVVDIVRDNGHGGKITGAIVELTVDVDGRRTVVQEIGTVDETWSIVRDPDGENVLDEYGRPVREDVTGTDGDRLKLAVSELWSRTGPWLYEGIVSQVLAAREAADDDSDVVLEVEEPEVDDSEVFDPDGS